VSKHDAKARKTPAGTAAFSQSGVAKRHNTIAVRPALLDGSFAPIARFTEAGGH
jgi:hypothetical protein